MALGYLFLVFIAMIVISLAGSLLLWFSKNEKVKRISFFAMSIWAIIVAYLGAHALPDNFVTQQVFFWLTAALVPVGIIVKYNFKFPKAADALIIASIVISFMRLFFF